MEEIIDKLRTVDNINELDISKVDGNILLLEIIKADRYDLLSNSNISIHIDDSESSKELIRVLLFDEDIIYYIRRNGFSFSDDVLSNMLRVINDEYEGELGLFFREFFSKDELNNFIAGNREFFINYLNEKEEDIAHVLTNCNNFIELILKDKRIKMIGKIEDYSVSNLKLLSSLVHDGVELPYHLARDRFAQHLFDVKDELTSLEFCELLNLLIDKSLYDVASRISVNSVFTDLVNNNIDYLIDVVTEVGFVPRCLRESEAFRDECIKNDRIDLAVSCILSKEIFENDVLVYKYCEELGIDLKDFYERGRWVLDYYERNNNVFNTLISTTLKDNIFIFGEEHIERFSNDTSIQIAIARLNDKENLLLGEILKRYNYEDYDVSFMITNIVNNIGDYSSLIDSLDVSSMSEDQIKMLISVIQVKSNPYGILDVDDLDNYIDRKKEYFENNYNNGNLDTNKNNLLGVLFNVNLEQAKYINLYFCYDKKENVLGKLENSELPKDILEYLKVINSIVESDNLDDIMRIYNRYKENKVYEGEIPLETFLRSEYTKLYNLSLYRVKEREEVYGPQDAIFSSTSYNGEDIKVCIPRANFNFLVHCVGYCSVASDVIDSNYQKDWEDRPQMQDHFVACSYINQNGIFSMISSGMVILGFSSLEGGALFGMGDTDIDSIGFYAKSYNASKPLMEGNGYRAHYFVPSLLLENVNNGYNEIVVERRNSSSRKEDHFKRVPDYIIMMADSLEPDNFMYLNNLYMNELSFVTEEDKQLIASTNNERELQKILVKYKSNIIENAASKNMEGKDLFNSYVSSVVKAKYYENCLKAASEFNVPLVVVDKTHYFNKILSDSGLYDDATIGTVSTLYSSANDSQKKRIFNMVAMGKDLSPLCNKGQSGPKLN